MWTTLWITAMMGLPAALRSAPAPPPRTSPNRHQEGAVPDQATMKWEAALELLAASGELGPGKVSVLRMTRVIDVDGDPSCSSLDGLRAQYHRPQPPSAGPWPRCGGATSPSR